MALILVRHAMPQVQPGVASSLWKLSESAAEDCVLLAHALPEQLAPAVYSSGQPKADQTAGIIALRRGLHVIPDSRFREVDQPPVWVEDYRTLAVAYLAGTDSAGWEPRDSVITRFAAAVRSALEAGHPGDTVIVSHGLAMSLWLSSVVEIDLVPFWRTLAFPDAWRVDLKARTLERLFTAGLPPEE